MHLIIKTLCPPKNKDHNVAFEWLRLNQYNAGNNFHSDTAIIEKYWKDQINAIKHNNQCIRYFHGYINNINIIIGYYIEGVDREGVITPDLKIHKLFKNCCTAYSINYHFRLNIMYIYQIAELLLKNIKKHLKVLYNKNIKIQIDDKIKNESTVQVLDYVSKLPLLFFPDEANLKKYLKITKNYNGFYLLYPHTDSVILYPGFHIKGRFMIEKYHLKYTFPYFKG